VETEEEELEEGFRTQEEVVGSKVKEEREG